MARIDNLENFLTDVATSIKNKKGTSDKIPAENFDTEIESIETGIDTSDATAEASDIASGKTAYVNGTKLEGTIVDEEGISPNGVEDTIIQEYTLGDDEVLGLTGTHNSVTSNVVRPGAPISVGVKKPQLAEYIGLTADVIKKGTTILGIEGTYEGDSSGEDLTDVLAEQEENITNLETEVNNKLNGGEASE